MLEFEENAPRLRLCPRATYLALAGVLVAHGHHVGDPTVNVQVSCSVQVQHIAVTIA